MDDEDIGPARLATCAVLITFVVMVALMVWVALTL